MVNDGQNGQRATVVKGLLLGLGAVVLTGVVGAIISRMVDTALDNAAETSGEYRGIPWKVYADANGQQQAMVLVPAETNWAFIEPAEETVEAARKAAFDFIDYYLGPENNDTDCGGGGDCD